MTGSSPFLSSYKKHPEIQGKSQVQQTSEKHDPSCASGNLHKHLAPRRGPKLLPGAAACPRKSYLPLKLHQYLSCLMKSCLVPARSSCPRCRAGCLCRLPAHPGALSRAADSLKWNKSRLEGNKSLLEGWHSLFLPSASSLSEALRAGCRSVPATSHPLAPPGVFTVIFLGFFPPLWIPGAAPPPRFALAMPQDGARCPALSLGLVAGASPLSVSCSGCPHSPAGASLAAVTFGTSKQLSAGRWRSALCLLFLSAARCPLLSLSSISIHARGANSKIAPSLFLLFPGSLRLLHLP